MRVSVVLCTYAESMYDDFREAADAVLDQTYDDVELVVVVDGTEAVFERVRDDYGDREDVVLHCNDENVGLLESRNTGGELSTGDVVAFIDDDAVPAPDWVELLVGAYEEHDRVAVGGKMTGRWVAGRPAYLPAEFDWLVGVTHRGFADGEGEVRNTFGSNISFRRDVFLELGGFDVEIGGRKGDVNMQGGETELAVRVREEYGQGVWYVPEAEVEHKVFEYRTGFWWLLDRAFWQGYSKLLFEKLVSGAGGDEEASYLGTLASDAVPARVNDLVEARSPTSAGRLAAIFVFTGAVGLGYVYGLCKWTFTPGATPGGDRS
ncbi:glucosyl-dolichyl phosphate glucuronosyltransferase [Halorarum halobium]|uniref:glucosyl-dolichyl phosphate glucuronosyltransferase n=1 Tax=Halorarum halobium TaxID=3075121 RepID=UPI0028A5F155|nr:glucosyl-dolichyl phosphate glucuronosyltransferase [Halobaculum sp. XH14]